jgi:hypothetical protein
MTLVVPTHVGTASGKVPNEIPPCVGTTQPEEVLT